MGRRFFLAGVACIACGGARPVASAPAERGESVDFSFAGLDGTRVGSAETRGRVTVILFATTFDISSQGQARRLDELVQNHSPRLNALLVVLEPPKNADLVRGFRDVLALSYPVAMADSQTLSGQGAFGDVRSVPAWVVLDREGRLRLAVAGQLAPTQLLNAVQAAE